jgi:hypothetical protein
MTRNDVISQAVDQCLKELYSYVQPKVTWEEFEKENEVYSNKYKVWESFKTAFHNKDKNLEIWLQYQASFPNWENKSITECIGPRPYEFYYLPKEVMKDICDNYIYAYNIDSQQELLNIISILKDYCRNPIVDKYINEYTDENGNWHPGYRSYDHPDNLEKELYNLIPDSGFTKSEIVESIQDKFFEFLDMAGKFYNWTRDLNTFNMNVYLGPSPNSNKEKVIENWKIYRNKDIEIDENQIKIDYYGEDYDE